MSSISPVCLMPGPLSSRALPSFRLCVAMCLGIAATGFPLSVHADASGSTPVTFAAPRLFPAGERANSIVVSDFNHDGLPDLATANDLISGSSTVAILLGRGDGTFPTRQAYPVGRGVIDMELGDFNEDGLTDIVVADWDSHDVTVLPGLEGGAFGSARVIPTGAYTRTVVVGDVDGDGHVDLVVACSEYLLLFRGAGDGSFDAGATIPDAPLPYGLALVDLDHDGDLDLCITSGNSVSVMLGDGGGGFAPPVSTYSAPSGTHFVTSGDINHDGNPDVLVVNGNNTMSVFRGNGDGSLQIPFTRGGVLYQTLVCTDLNGDGKADVVVADNAGYVSIDFGDGNTGVLWHVNIPAGAFPEDLVVADLDMDGLPDVATANTSSGTVGVLLADGSPWLRAYQLSNTYMPCWDLALGDLNGDAKLDLLVLQDGNFLQSYLGNGDGTFSFKANLLSIGARQVLLSDLDGDGRLDLVQADYNGDDVSVRPGLGDGNFAVGVTYPTPDAPKAVAVGDVNRDGLPDIVVGHGTRPPSLLRGTGSGLFELATAMTATMRSESVALDDLNQDGWPDIVCANFNKVSVCFGHGDGTFDPPVDYACYSRATVVVTGRFDGDAFPDVVVADQLGERVSIFLNLGDGTLGARTDIVVGDQVRDIGAADLNDDGIVDLAVADDANAVGILAGRGDGTFHPLVQFAVASEPRCLAFGDLDGDGRQDILTGHYTRLIEPLYNVSSSPLDVPRDAPAARVRLRAAYPNPAAGQVAFDVSLPAASSLEVDILDLSGRRLRRLHSGPEEAGSLCLRWDLRDGAGHRVPAGLYFCVVRGEGASAVRRFVVRN